MWSRTFATAALSIAVTSALVTASTRQSDRHDHGGHAGRLGTVHFATSCAPAVQKEFDRGVALLHSFWFSAAIESFNTRSQRRPALRDGPLGYCDELVG